MPLKSDAVTLSIQLLGGFTVRLDDRVVTGWRSEKTKWLFAYLVLIQREVSFAHLEQLLWKSGKADSVKITTDVDSANARQSLTNLYKLVGTHWFHKPTRSSVHLDLSSGRDESINSHQANNRHANNKKADNRQQAGSENPVSVDVFAYDEAIRLGNLPGHSLPILNPPIPSLPDLKRAIALYCGPLLPDCMEPWLAEMRETRAQQYRQALFTLAEAAMKEGDYDAAQDFLHKAVAESPLRSSARSDLMRLLVRQGDLQAALTVYRELVHLLSNDASAQPDAAITAFYEDIRRKSRVCQIGQMPVTEEQKDPFVVPAPTVTLVGREQALSDVMARLTLKRFVTLTGPPGVGKTQLALRAAWDMAECFPDGIAFVDLSEARTPRCLVRKLLSVLHIKVNPDQSEEEAIFAALQARHVLLILDNCEPLIEACAALTRDLLHKCPHLRILATSQQALHLTLESVYDVCPLALPPQRLPAHSHETLLSMLPQFSSVQLFIERAKDSDPGFALTNENAAAVADLCRRLEGLPLALEMLATWANSLSPTQMLLQMVNPFVLLISECSDVPTRHRSLETAIATSYAWLSKTQQRLLAQLSIFEDGWSPAAAARVCNEPASLQALRFLQQCSLVATTGQATKRQRLLEPIRAFARRQLSAPDAALLGRRHALYYRDLILEAEPSLRGADQAAVLQQLEDDYPNLRTAFHWACANAEAEMALQMMGSLWRFWYIRGSNREGDEWLTRAFAMEAQQARPVGDAIRIKALAGGGSLAFQRAEYGRARDYFTQQLSLAEKLSDQRSIASALGNLANIASEEGLYTEASAYLERCHKTFHALNDLRSEAFALGNRAVILCRLKDYTRAAPLFAEGITLLEAQGDTLNLVMALHNLADLKMTIHEETAVGALLAQSLPLAGKVGSPRGLLQGLALSASLALREGDMERAGVLQGACEAVQLQNSIALPPDAAAQGEAERSTVETSLGKLRYEEALGYGRSLPLQQAIAAALNLGAQWNHAE